MTYDHVPESFLSDGLLKNATLIDGNYLYINTRVRVNDQIATHINSLFDSMLHHPYFCFCNACNYMKHYKTSPLFDFEHYPSLSYKDIQYRWLAHRFKCLFTNNIKAAVKKRFKRRIFKYYKAKKDNLEELNMHPVFLSRRMEDMEEDDVFEYYGY